MQSLELKIIPPLVTLICGTLMWGLASITPEFTVFAQFSDLGSKLFIGLGVLLMLISGFFFFKAHTTINPMKPEDSSALVTSGLYNFTRNPIYLGDLLVLVGWAFYLENFFSLLLITGFVLYMNRFQIIPAERALAASFGEDYKVYKQRVRRWI